MKRAIITGASGFIGSHLIHQLVDAGVEVWANVTSHNTSKNRLADLPKIHIVECELSELQSHLADFPKKADVMYHLAWQGVNPDCRNDFDLQIENIPLSLNCIRFAAMAGVKKFILPGSTSEYLYYSKPINENAIPSAQNAYGSVKIATRFLCEELARQLKVGFIYVVTTGIYAADRRDNNVIFYTIDQLLDGKKPSLTKLEQKWDYIHIDDLIEALYLIGKKGKTGRFYAIGHGDNQPLNQYIGIIKDLINPMLPLGIGEIPYVDNRLPSSCIDLSALQEDTGFVPKISFENGIRDVINRVKLEKSSC